MELILGRGEPANGSSLPHLVYVRLPLFKISDVLQLCVVRIPGVTHLEKVEQVLSFRISYFLIVRMLLDMDGLVWSYNANRHISKFLNGV